MKSPLGDLGAGRYKKKSAPIGADLLDTNKDIDSKKYLFSLIKDILLGDMLYPLRKKILQEPEFVSDLDITLANNNCTPACSMIKCRDCTITKIFIHAFAWCAITGYL